VVGAADFGEVLVGCDLVGEVVLLDFAFVAFDPLRGGGAFADAVAEFAHLPGLR